MKYSKLAIVGFVLSFIPVICLFGLLLSIKSLLVFRLNNNLKGKSFSIAGIIISIIMIIISIFITFKLYDYNNELNNTASRMEFANFVGEVLIATKNKYDELSINVDEMEYPIIFDVKGLDINTNKKLDSYQGYILVDYNNNQSKYVLVVYSSKYELLYYNYLENGAINYQSVNIKDYNKNDIPIDELDICENLEYNHCLDSSLNLIK